MSLTTSASSAFEAVNTAAASACESNAILVDLPDGQQANVLWVTLEGPIGAGKTELTKVLMPALRAEYGDNRVFFVAEPIDELLASGLFQDYQRDPVRWAFEFQIACFDLRTDYFRAAWEAMCAKVAATSAPQDAMHCGIKTVVMLSERSIVSDTCFMRVQYVYGHCSEVVFPWRRACVRVCSIFSTLTAKQTQEQSAALLETQHQMARTLQGCGPWSGCVLSPGARAASANKRDHWNMPATHQRARPRRRGEAGDAGVQSKGAGGARSRVWPRIPAGL